MYITQLSSIFQNFWLLRATSLPNWRIKELLKMTQMQFYMKELECLKRKTNALKTKLKISKIIEILITNDKCTDEWKIVKTKSKNNRNIASPSSLSPKNPSPVNLQNRFDNLIVTEVNQTEIHEP